MQCPNLSPGWEVYTCHQTKRDTAVRRATLREGKFRMWEKILPRVPTEGNQTVFELDFSIFSSKKLKRRLLKLKSINKQKKTLHLICISIEASGCAKKSKQV